MQDIDGNFSDRAMGQWEGEGSHEVQVSLVIIGGSGLTNLPQVSTSLLDREHNANAAFPCAPRIFDEIAGLFFSPVSCR